MDEKVTLLINAISSLEEELSDFAIHSLTNYFQSFDETPDAKELERVRQLEKSISKAQRALEKARVSLGEI